jgi:hypothetical protein
VAGRDGDAAAAERDVASFYEGTVPEAVAAVQAAAQAYAFSLRSPVPALEELYFRVSRPHRNSLEYLGVFCAKLELAYARALVRSAPAMSARPLPPSLLGDLAAAFSPYLIRPKVWGSTMDAAARRRARFLQHRFVLLFWFFFKRKHNLVTRAERADLHRGSQEVRVCTLSLQLPPGTHIHTCTHTHIHNVMQTNTHEYVHTCTITFTHTYTYTPILPHIHTYTHAHAHTTPTYTHLHRHAQTHTHTTTAAATSRHAADPPCFSGA